MIDKFDQWHKTKIGLAIFSIAELAVAYGFASLAIDRGNIWWYILAILFLFGGLQNFIKLIGAIFSGKHKANKA